MRDVLAVVVTHDRLALLRECLDALRAQTVPCDILVVDNASTDGTKEYLQGERSPSLAVCSFTENRGGAGGFRLGVRYGRQKGYAYLWLMDDDVLPRPDALSSLLRANALLHGEYGFLSSLALFPDGTP